jgi:hypothetical protein
VVAYGEVYPESYYLATTVTSLPEPEGRLISGEWPGTCVYQRPLGKLDIKPPDYSMENTKAH